MVTEAVATQPSRIFHSHSIGTCSEASAIGIGTTIQEPRNKCEDGVTAACG